MTIILSAMLCVAVSILVSTVVTCVTATKIYQGTHDYVEKAMRAQEEEMKQAEEMLKNGKEEVQEK